MPTGSVFDLPLAHQHLAASLRETQRQIAERDPAASRGRRVEERQTVGLAHNSAALLLDWKNRENPAFMSALAG